MYNTNRFKTHDAPLLENPSEYRRIMGKLLYLTVTRPNISYTVQIISQYMSCPNEFHMSAVHRLLRFLKSTIGQGPFYSAKKLTLNFKLSDSKQGVHKLGEASQVLQFTWVIISYFGSLKSRQQSADRQLK